MIPKILKWKCPDCDKEITSIHQVQFEYNKKAHQQKHEAEDVQDAK